VSIAALKNHLHIESNIDAVLERTSHFTKTPRSGSHGGISKIQIE